MTDQTLPLIFDGHNDVLYKQTSGTMQGFIEGCDAHIDLPKAAKGGFGGGFFAIWVASRLDEESVLEAMRQPKYKLPLPPAVPRSRALGDTLHQVAILRRLEARGALKICTTVADIRACLGSGKMAAVMHLEGAEAIDTGFDALEVLYAAGLRSLGPVWSRPTVFGNGVPFAFPSSPDTGGGLSGAGRELVRECNRLGIMLDLSHLNAKGFWDVAGLSDAPLVATHSNAHAICAHARNLTDDQLAAIRESDGMVGLNFATAFLRPDGRMIDDIGFEVMLRHLDHLISHLGEERVGLGSDFDGAQMPAVLGDAAGLPALREAMRAHGYDDALMVRLCHENWLGLLERTWKQP